ncbi:Transposon Tf2-12 polyprotein [Rhizoctonia solani]|uniref:Transposon Tf2-12 polyprotein n=1 Tax=Rhizoctonia solani TaxID=456999 RepID=A0A0K6FVL4_9AGAM|nr:Transposon Tf2-12 polyprotein [Rhizoctonia solani]
MSTPSYHPIDAMALDIPDASNFNDNTVLKALADIKMLLVAMNHNLALAITQSGAHTKDLKDAGKNFQKQEDSINDLNTSIVRIIADVSRILSGTSSSSSAGKAPKLATPDKFDGTDKNKATSFRVAVTHYLRVSYPSSTVDKQIAFIILCLDGKAHEWLEPYLKEDVVSGTRVAWLHSLNDFWTQFNARWNVQNRTENFRAKLCSLKQTKSVQEYFKDFQTYSQGLGYNDVSLRDMFYDGLSIKIKEMLMAQDFDHSDASISLQNLADKALKIDQRLEQFQAQNKGLSHGQSSSGSKKEASPSTAPQGTPRARMSVGEKVYLIGPDGKAKKGMITKIGKNKKGLLVPTVKWNNGLEEVTTFKGLNKDKYPADAPSAPKPPKPSGSGPQPMDLDAASSSKKGKTIICNTCGDWPKKRVVFSSHFCSSNCLSSRNDILGDVSGYNHLEGTPEDLGGVEVTYKPLEGIPREAGDVVAIPLEGVPVELHEYADVFSEDKVTELPPHRSYDLEIDLIDPNKPVKGPVYPVRASDDEEMRKTLKEQLDKGLIVPSKSKYSSPVHFVNKKNGKRRMVVDYRQLNANTVKNAYPLPLIQTLVEKLRGSTVFSTLDLKSGYNLVHIRKGDKWKTAFKTKYGLFEYRVMPFGLCNAPAVFQHFMNDVFRDILDVYVVVYLDDILIFSKSQEEHVKHVQEVLKRLRDNACYCNLEKCFFFKSEVEYLGVIASGEGVRANPDKITKAVDWATPQSVKGVQEFLGFINFYRRFIKDFNKLAVPLYRLINKNVPWTWGTAEEESFNALKKALMDSPILIQPDPSKEFFLECNASDFTTGAILNQKGSDNKLHPVAYLSKTLAPAERNYDIYDKELLAVIRALKEWRHLPGVQNGKADILSRKEEHREEAKGGSETPVLIRPELFISAITTDSDLNDMIRDALPDDKVVNKILKSLEEEVPVKGWTLDNGLLYYHNRIYVPNELQIHKAIIESRHDNPSAGHPGQFRTLDLLSRTYYWKGMKNSVVKYIQSCDSCLRSKQSNQAPMGLLQPIELPNKPWEEITYDLIVGLPESEGYDAILTVVDHLSKMVYFIPTHSDATATDVANLFVNFIWKLHGLPRKTISDQGPQFNVKFLRQVYKHLNIEPHFSTVYRPQVDGQSERLNQFVEIYLRHYINYRQTDWVAALPLAEFAYNNGKHSGSKHSPFYLCYGYNPDFTVGNTSDNKVPQADELATFLKEVQEEAKAALEIAQRQQAQYYDAKRRDAAKLEVGDKVYLSSANVKTSRPSHKLEHKRLGPYKILEKVGKNSYKLELPKSMKIHPVFNIALLHKKPEDEYKCDPVPLPPVITKDGEEEYIVERILDSRKKGRRLEYYVKWKGYRPEENTWEPKSHLANAPEKLASFHRKFPEAAGP